ncbi:MAG: hypothetical protein Q8R47_05105, partial [Nanoarchaeota archaeon]|nr:hypothetical protein [Nanoarchaeota archaeon]
SNGACVMQPQQVCTANQWACEGTTAKKQCKADGSGYNTKVDCASGETCSNGACVVQPQQVCTANQWLCEGTTAKKQCKADGSGYNAQVNCASGETCSNGACVMQPQQVCTANQWACEGTTAKKQCKADGSGYNTKVDCASGETCSNGVCAAVQLQPVSVIGKKITLTDVAAANNVFATKVTATETFTNEVTVYTILYNKDGKVLSIKSEKLEAGLAKDVTYTASVNYPEANVKKKSVIVYDVKQNPSVFGQLEMQKS